MPAIRVKYPQSVYIFLIALSCAISIYIVLQSVVSVSNKIAPRNQLPRRDAQLMFGTDKVSHTDIEYRDVSKSNLPQRRKGAIIVAHGKSGSSFTLGMFNFNELIFAAYEPFIHTEWWKQSDTTGTFNQTEAVLDLITAFMTCTFSKHQHAVNFLREYSTHWSRRLVSNVFNSPPFCKAPNSGDESECIELDAKVVDEECLKKNYSVIKVMYNRLPDRSIGIFQTAAMKLKKQMDLRIIHLVRDPRGTINSRINLGWIKDDPSNNLEPKSREVCELVLNNLLVGEKFSQEMKTNYMVLKYDNISNDIIKTAENLYKFTEMEITPSLLTWLIKHVRPARAEKWKTQSSDARTALVEKTCRPLLTWLNIEPSTYEKTF